MDLTTRLLTMGASGSGSAPTYVEDVFSTWLYTGQGTGTVMTVDNGIDLAGKGGMVWLKARSTTFDHELIDTVRGTRKAIRSNTTAAQVTNGDLGEFTSSGFKLGGTGSGGFQVGIGDTYASWTFRKAAKFFDVVTFTAGSNTNRRISHSLGSVPGTIIIKSTSAIGAWYVYHRSLGRSSYIVLNTTGGSTTQTNFWGTSDPTSTDFGLDETAAFAAGTSAVAYLFAHDTGTDGLIQCGTSTSGTFNNLGWEPQWVLAKPTTNDSWYIYDNMRGLPASGTTPYLNTDLSNAEVNGTNNVTVTATGFTQNLGNCVWIAIRRGPMRTPTDATKVFYQLTRSGTSATASISNFGFPPDYFMSRARNNIADQTFQVYDKLRGPLLQLSSISTSGEASYAGSVTSFNQDGVTLGADAYAGGVNYTGGNYIYHSFRRAPGFFDVVAYTGTGSNNTVSHSLTKSPELAIIKCRSTTAGWAVAFIAGDNYGFLNLTSSFGTGLSSIFTVSSSSFTVSATGNAWNGSAQTYIAYLFASCPGVSKVGSYTGTGTTLQINCGFTAGARFVLIKRTDNTGDWYVWDTARGIVSGNDPYLLLNSGAAEVTSTDYIDPLNSGFEISSTAPAAINANGGTFVYLAIA